MTRVKNAIDFMPCYQKREEITKRQAKALKEWEKVDNKVGARRTNFLKPHISQGT